MFANYLKIAVRILIKKKLFLFTNVIGLSIGMAVCTLISLWIWDEVSFDRYHDNYEKIAKVRLNVTSNGEITTTKTVPLPLVDELSAHFKDDFKYIVPSSHRAYHILGYEEKKLFKKGVYLGNQAPMMLSLKMIKGDISALNERHSIILSESTAKVFFGDQDPINKIMTIDNGESVKVTGVYEKDSPNLFYNPRATADVLIAATKLAGDQFAQVLPFNDEVEYIQSKLTNLVGQADGSFGAPEINSFSAYFQQHGGWWRNPSEMAAPVAASALGKTLEVGAADFTGEGEFFFKPFLSPTLGEAGANKPWLQELADPTTTVMWNTWVEINPKTAEELGIEDDDVVRVVSEAGTVEASVYKYPAIRPDTIAMPFGQGHTAYGSYAQGRGVNPADILGADFNEAGDLAFMGMKVKVEKTGKKRELSRMEGKLGVYGFTAEK